MSADIRTRRVIVTLPNVSGEEADIAIAEIENYLGDTALIKPRVEHALDDAPLPGMVVRANLAWRDTVTVQQAFADRHDMSVSEARKFAALLLRAADEAEDGAR